MENKFHGVTKTLVKYRKQSLEKRTAAELWAQNILFSKFKNENISIEHIYGFRRFDFFIPKLKTVIEIDGRYHKTIEMRKKDRDNDDYLFRRRGIKVFRVNNFDSRKMSLVCEQIEQELKRFYTNNTDKLKIKKVKTKKKNLKKEIYLKKMTAKTKVEYVFKPRFILKKKFI